MPESLQSKQSRFARMVAALIVKATELGYEVTFGEAYRTPEQAALNAKSGKGISNSLHTERLAIDLNLFRDGKYLADTESHRPLGEWWESIGGAWGGGFAKPDGNHYSLAHNGRK
jgi:hypothetical protein